MKTTKITQNISYALLGLFTIYGIFSIPFAFFLLSIAIGLIVYGFGQPVEITTAVVLITGALLVIVNNYKKPTEGFSSDSAVQITERVKQITRTQPRQPIGVYASGYVEGFEDVSNEPTVPKEKEAGEEEEKVEETETGDKEKTAKSGSALPTVKSESATSKPAPVETKSGFQNKVAEPEGLFKLGVMPSESKTGPHIDQGTTVLNALNALNPDQVKQMSEDTQKLIDTQKSLMSMLGTMKPMLSDGKQLIDTFQTMFGPVPQGLPAIK